MSVILELTDTGRQPLDKPHPSRVQQVIDFARMRGFNAVVVEPQPTETKPYAVLHHEKTK